MKTTLRTAVILSLLVTGFTLTAQTLCIGSSTVLTASNSSGLTNPSYSLNPGAITSSGPNFTVTPSITTTYTLYVTGTNTISQVVTTSSTVTIVPYGTTYGLVSPNNFTLGCSTKSMIAVNIVNANTTPVAGGPVSYTILPPGSSTVLPMGNLGQVSTASVTVTGNWSVAVRDNVSGCNTWSTFVVTSNLTPPAIPNLTLSANPVTCLSPTTIVTAPVDTTLVHTWLPGSIFSNSVAVNANFSNPTQSLVTTLTLQLTSINNLCLSGTIVPVLQNIYPPIAAIGTGGGSLTCQTGTIMLTNQSSSGIPTGVFSTTAPVVGFLWEGPSPQLPLSISSHYVAYTPGTYTLTAVDNNNGCIDQATKIVANIGPVAAFTHTVLNGVASFSDVSNGTGPGTNYFWKFGDGATSTARHPTHTYQNAGSHLVKFFVTNTLCVDSVIQSVNITGLPCTANSGFTLLPTSASQVWLAIPAYPYNVSAARWDWGDNSNSNTLFTAHQYSAAGMYNICLSVTVNCVASSSTCTSYSVYRSAASAGIIQVNVVAPEVVAGIGQLAREHEVTWRFAPNPSDAGFIMELPDLPAHPVRLSISDITGRVVYQQMLESHVTTHTINTSHLAPGMFIVTVEMGGSTESRRIIVQH